MCPVQTCHPVRPPQILNDLAVRLPFSATHTQDFFGFSVLALHKEIHENFRVRYMFAGAVRADTSGFHTGKAGAKLSSSMDTIFVLRRAGWQRVSGDYRRQSYQDGQPSRDAETIDPSPVIRHPPPVDKRSPSNQTVLLILPFNVSYRTSRNRRRRSLEVQQTETDGVSQLTRR